MITRRQPELHKRWILCATSALLGAAVGRVIQDEWLYRAVWVSPLVTMMLIDVSTRRRVHLVSLVVFAVLVAASFKVTLFAMSPMWAAVGRWLLGLSL